MPEPTAPSRSKPLPSVTLVLPAYNEAARIGPALDELFAYLDRPPSDMGPVEVLVVDDGSTDDTVDIVERRPEVAAGRLKLLREPHGGKGAAVRAGMLAAESDDILFADADLATPPDQLPLLTAALREHDVALGQPRPARWFGSTRESAAPPAHRRAAIPLRWPPCGLPGRCPTPNADSRASAARPRTTSSGASR